MMPLNTWLFPNILDMKKGFVLKLFFCQSEKSEQKKMKYERYDTSIAQNLGCQG